MDKLSFLEPDQLRRLLPSKWSSGSQHTISLTTGELDLRPPMSVLQEFSEAVFECPLGYQQHGGDSSVRQAIVEFEASRRSWPLTKDNITLVVGVRAAVNSLLSASARAGNSALLLIGTPTYRPLIDGTGQWYEKITLPFLEGGRLDFSPIEKRKSKKITAVLVVNPHNPTGLAIHPDDLHAILAIASENDALIISNEVNAHTTYSGSQPTITDLDLSSNVRWVVVSSLSKWFCVTGANIGYCLHANPNIFKDMKLQFTPLTRPSALDQHLLMICTQVGHDWLQMVRDQLSKNAQTVVNFFQHSIELRGLRPVAGSSVWIPLPEWLPSGQLVNQISKHANVDCWDNQRFHPNNVNGFRISIGASPAIIQEACDRIEINWHAIINGLEHTR